MFTFFKQAVHSVCSWFLEGEVQDTKAVARQFEQRKSDLEANIRQKQNEYAKSLQALSRLLPIPKTWMPSIRR